jgi:Protein kinase domain
MSSPDTPRPTPSPSQSPETVTGDVVSTRGPELLGAPLVEEGELLGGRFSILQQIGRGGAGTVFSAFDTKVGQKVAVKVLHADIREASQLERLRREVRASRPGHPNAVAVYDLFDDGRRRFLTMELIDGRSLSHRLASGERLPVDGTAAMGRQIAAALADLHAKGLVHRDVKPGNILLAPDGNAKLCDMGLARSTMRGGTITETEMVVGTPAYMAPEQALAGDLTAASDVYALGLTIYQCLTGEVPLQEDTAVATLMLRQRSRPPKVRSECDDCPKWLDRLIRRMLNPVPDERPTAAEVEVALAEQRVRIQLKPRRRHLVAALIAALVVIGSFIGVRAYSRIPAETVEAIGSDVVGFDERGVELWRHRLEQLNVEVLRSDLDGDGSPEVLAVGRNDTVAGVLPGDVRHSGVLILRASGEILTRLDPESEIGRWPYRYRLEVTPTLHALDLDEDGWLEVIAVCRQRRYFPTEVLVYWPRWNIWEKVLSHPGSIYEVYPPRKGSHPGFRFFGVNNKLAMYVVFGEMWLVPPNQRSAAIKGRPLRAEAPPFGHLVVGPSGGLSDYVPLIPQRVAAGRIGREIEVRAGGGWDITIYDRPIGLDAHLNPADGPNTGRDLHNMRVNYYRLLHAARPGFNQFTSDVIAGIRHEMTVDCGPLLAEPAYETIFLDTVARALAWADDRDGAVDLLREAFARLRNDDLGFRLANLEAIGGDLESASSWLRILMDQGQSRRAGFDAPQLMLRVAIEGRDAERFGGAVSFLTSLFRDAPERLEIRNAMWAGARLWWDESSDADTRVRSTDYAEDGDAVACLIRWRRGTGRGSDPSAMSIYIENNPDAAGIGRAALAAALVGNGRAAEAIEECDTATTMLEEWSRDDFREYQNLELVRAIRTVALVQAGDRELGRREALRLVDDLNPSLLPGILIAEVLAETGD